MTRTDQLNEVQRTYLGLLIDAGCQFLFKTEKWGKEYVMMKSPDGVLFLERLPDE